MSDPHYPIADTPQLSAGNITVTTMLYDILYNASERSTLPRLLLSSAAGHSGSETVLQCRLVFGVHLTDVFERWEFRSSYMRSLHLILTSVFRFLSRSLMDTCSTPQLNLME